MPSLAIKLFESTPFRRSSRPRPPLTKSRMYSFRIYVRVPAHILRLTKIPVCKRYGGLFHSRRRRLNNREHFVRTSRIAEGRSGKMSLQSKLKFGCRNHLKPLSREFLRTTSFVSSSGRRGRDHPMQGTTPFLTQPCIPYPLMMIRNT